MLRILMGSNGPLNGSRASYLNDADAVRYSVNVYGGNQCYFFPLLCLFAPFQLTEIHVFATPPLTQSFTTPNDLAITASVWVSKPRTFLPSSLHLLFGAKPWLLALHHLLLFSLDLGIYLGALGWLVTVVLCLYNVVRSRDYCWNKVWLTGRVGSF